MSTMAAGYSAPRTGVDSRMMPASPMLEMSILAAAKKPARAGYGMRGSRVWKYCPTQEMSPTQVLKQAMRKMAAKSSCPARPNRVLARAERTSAPVGQSGAAAPVSAPTWPSMA